MGKMHIRYDDIKIAKVIGENEEGLTLFVPKSMDGTFKLSEGDHFNTILFVRSTTPGNMEAWTPWEE